MCFGGSQQPTAPTPQPPPAPPPPTPAPPPPTPAPPPRPLSSGDDKQQQVKSRTTARERLAISRGTSQLRIPLNIGQSKSGGINL